MTQINPKTVSMASPIVDSKKLDEHVEAYKQGYEQGRKDSLELIKAIEYTLEKYKDTFKELANK